jgi:predicted TIM-barrel fold metal-dependent hydrolase
MIVSADSHICEAPDLWQDRLPAKLRSRAPRIVRNLDGRAGDFFVCEDVPPRSVFAAFGAGVPTEQLRERNGLGYDVAPQSVWSPRARLAEQDRDGVHVEVLYPTLADLIFGCRDPELRLACFAAYNDAVAEYCAVAPDRLVGCAVVDLTCVPQAVAEVRRAHRLGLRGLVLQADLPTDSSYGSRSHDPVFEAALDCGMVIGIHRGALRKDLTREVSGPLVDYTLIHTQAQRALAGLVFGGTLERFPALRVVFCEFDVQWLPHLVRRMDHAYTKFGSNFGLQASRLPSQQVRDQISFTFQTEVEVLASLATYLGPDGLMWASDYPHADSTWPHSGKLVASLLQSAGQQYAASLLQGAASRLYGLSQPTTC